MVGGGNGGYMAVSKRSRRSTNDVRCEAQREWLFSAVSIMKPLKASKDVSKCFWAICRVYAVDVVLDGAFAVSQRYVYGFPARPDPYCNMLPVLRATSTPRVPDKKTGR